MPKVASAAVAPWDRTDLRDAGSALIAVDCLEVVVAWAGNQSDNDISSSGEFRCEGRRHKHYNYTSTCTRTVVINLISMSVHHLENRKK